MEASNGPEWANYLGGQRQAEEESQCTSEERDGRLPRLETAGTEGDEPADDAVPDGQLMERDNSQKRFPLLMDSGRNP